MNNKLKLLPVMIPFLSLFPAVLLQAQEPGLGILHLSNEQNIVDLCPEKDYLMIPVEDAAPEGRMYVVEDNHVRGTAMNIRFARARVDYFVPFDVSACKGRRIRLDVQGVPASSICWSGMYMADTYPVETGDRPLYHHTPAYGWMNDPNGMFYKDGTYHLYYQHNPYGNIWGNMHWRHSVSRDLVHWEDKGIAISPDAWGTVFSGSAVVDHGNTSGFGEGAVVAFYTSSKPTGRYDCQSQSVAFSLDGGMTFDKYCCNPVLTSMEQDFRDPKVFWYSPGRHWVMILAAGQEMQIYSSDNLLEWKMESSFGEGQGAHGGVWECPDLVELPVEGTDMKKWVLICNLNPGGPAGGSASQYFVGSFDGRTFVNEAPGQTKWMDWGKDNYATVTWSNAPDGRCIAIGWMSNWQYQSLLPVKGYRGANTVPRELSLYVEDGQMYLKSAPVAELESARVRWISSKTFKVEGKGRGIGGISPESGAYEVVMKIRDSGAGKVGFVFGNSCGDKVTMYYDAEEATFVMDRTMSGNVDFSKDFPAVTTAPVRMGKDMEFRIFFDRNSVEIFGDDGRFVMTNLVFPSEQFDRVDFYSEGGRYSVSSFDVYEIR